MLNDSRALLAGVPDGINDGDKLLSKFIELCGLGVLAPTMRSYDGPFDPNVSRMMFGVIWTAPLSFGNSIHPMETYGVMQRLLHSKDEKHWCLSYPPDRVPERRGPDPVQKKALGLLREVKELAERTNLWPTLVDPATGSWHPAWEMNPPGCLNPAPSAPVLVPLDDYRKVLEDAAAKARLGLDHGLGLRRDPDESPEDESEVNMSLCRKCARPMTPRKLKPDDPDGVIDVECKTCEYSIRKGPVKEPTFEERLPFMNLGQLIEEEFG